MPSMIPDGASYQVSGTVTNIPDGSTIQVEVKNNWSINGFPYSHNLTVPCTVSGGAFYVDTPFQFHGPGYFSIKATYVVVNGFDVTATDGGSVMAPLP